MKILSIRENFLLVMKSIDVLRSFRIILVFHHLEDFGFFAFSGGCQTRPRRLQVAEFRGSFSRSGLYTGHTVSAWFCQRERFLLQSS